MAFVIESFLALNMINLIMEITMKALWALEPFHQDSKGIQGMHRMLAQLTGDPAQIEVGFIVTRNESDLNLAFKVPQKQRFTLYPRKLLKAALQKAKCTIAEKKIHVIDFNTITTTQTVDRLLKLAHSRGADLIALHTHSRKGFMRLALGSFAETAIHRSKKSLLLMNPKSTWSGSIKQILFASDFTPGSEKHLKKSIELSKQLGAKLTVFHQAQINYKWSLDESNPQIQNYRKEVNKMYAKIIHLCEGAGIAHEIVLAAEFSGASDLILKTAKKVKADLIIVSAKVGPLAALMGGSTTRQVIRESTKPVLVLK
jgi:nucleotide-binding universal stress UspA family protein